MADSFLQGFLGGGKLYKLLSLTPLIMQMLDKSISVSGPLSEGAKTTVATQLNQAIIVDIDLE